jgi:hypothetical protein
MVHHFGGWFCWAEQNGAPGSQASMRLVETENRANHLCRAGPGLRKDRLNPTNDHPLNDFPIECAPTGRPEAVACVSHADQSGRRPGPHSPAANTRDLFSLGQVPLGSARPRPRNPDNSLSPAATLHPGTDSSCPPASPHPKKPITQSNRNPKPCNSSTNTLDTLFLITATPSWRLEIRNGHRRGVAL